MALITERSQVICTLAADMYNDAGDLEGATFSHEDFTDLVEKYQGMHEAYGIRKPTEDEIRTTITQVMGATIAVD